MRRGRGDPGGRDEEGDGLAEGSEMRRGWACPCFYLSKNLSSDKGDGDQLPCLLIPRRWRHCGPGHLKDAETG